MRVATDIGGTFTDIVYIDDASNVRTAKSHSTPGEFEKGVMEVIRKTGIAPNTFKTFVHGSTIVINAITERKGAKTGLIMTKGFRDIIEIARGNRPDFFNLDYEKPKPFIPRYLRKEIAGRISYKGMEVAPLDYSELPEIIEDFKKEGVEAIAICLMNSYANPLHEEQLAQKIRFLWPEVSVVVSTQITREWREYERTNTAALSAYVQPVAREYLTKLTNDLSRRDMSCTPYIMQSNCGVDTVKAAMEIPITMVESGPASGVWGAAVLGRLLGEPDIIALDIGGTTAKCGLISKHNVSMITSYYIERTPTNAGYPIMVPVVDLVEIGNGGGSIAWVDEYRKLHVGPLSAGAKPGPVAYGQGGTRATTTDANLALNRINPHFFCGGEQKADMSGVSKALRELAKELGTTETEAARGIIRIANNNMVNALKLVSLNRGYDPRDFTLVAFGGGGSMHACDLAADLGIRAIVIPRNADVFSAWGMLMTDLRRDFVKTQIVELSGVGSSKSVESNFIELEKRAIRTFEVEGIDPKRVVLTRFAKFRYQNQEHSVEVKISPHAISEAEISTIIENFHEEYEREYSYRLDAPVEIVTFHVVAVFEVDKLVPQKQSVSGRTLAECVKEERTVDFLDRGCHIATIYNGDLLEPGMKFLGPAVIEMAGSTTVIPPKIQCEVDEYGNLRLATGGRENVR